MRTLFPAVVLLIATAPTFGQKLTLPAETKVQPGEEYVVLQPETDCKAVSYIAQSGVSPFPSQFLADKRVFILPVRGLPQGRYLFTAVGSLNDNHVRQAFSVIVGTAPPPGPVPPVPPSPVEKLGFATLARAEGIKLPDSARPLASQLADNFEAVAARLAATAQMTIDQGNAELRDRNRATLGDQGRAQWLPWFQAWQALADKHNAAGAMTTKEHYVTAYQETAAGLRTVR